MKEEKSFEPIPPVLIERITEMTDETLSFLEENFTDVEWDKENLEKFVSRIENILLIAKKEQEGAGLLRGHMLSRYDGKGVEVLLHEIDVLPAYQKQGIASALIEKLKEVSLVNGASEIWVLTNNSNEAAMGLYDKAGMRRQNPDDVMFTIDL